MGGRRNERVQGARVSADSSDADAREKVRAQIAEANVELDVAAGALDRVDPRTAVIVVRRAGAQPRSPCGARWGTGLRDVPRGQLTTEPTSRPSWAAPRVWSL
jgi:hypothetical protein